MKWQFLIAFSTVLINKETLLLFNLILFYSILSHLKITTNLSGK